MYKYYMNESCLVRYVLLTLFQVPNNERIKTLFFNYAGGTWEADQELSQHPSAITSSLDADGSGYFERLGATTETILEKYFTIWGTYCANNPWFILFLGRLLESVEN